LTLPASTIAALWHLAALAPGLTLPALRLGLAALTGKLSGATSNRQIAIRAGIARATVEAARGQLAACGISLSPDVENFGQVAAPRPGVATPRPPFAPVHSNHARASLLEEEDRPEREINLSSPKLTESDFHTQGELAEVARALASWMEKQAPGVELAPAYPTPEFCRDLLMTTGSAARLLTILDALRDQGAKPGHSWGWFIVVSRQRIHGHKLGRKRHQELKNQPGLPFGAPGNEFEPQTASDAPRGADPRRAGSPATEARGNDRAEHGPAPASNDDPAMREDWQRFDAEALARAAAAGVKGVPQW
jgi:hypothetical protein